MIEFQHSAIKAEEVKKRCDFYGNVIWVVDATRRPTDAKQYAEMLDWCRTERFGDVDIHTVHYNETRLLREWGSIGRIVGFDFGGDHLSLLTAAQGTSRYLFDFPKAAFVKSVTEGEPLPTVQFKKPVQRRHRRRRRY